MNIDPQLLNIRQACDSILTEATLNNEKVAMLQSAVDDEAAQIIVLNQTKDTQAQEIQAQAQQITDLKAKLAQQSQAGQCGISRALLFLNREPWNQPANAGDSGGSDPTKVSGTFTGTPGDVATWTVKGNYPYNNGYWYKKYLGLSPAVRVIQMLDVMFPTAADIAACNAIEFECQQNFEDHVYNMAWQCSVDNPAKWRTFQFTEPKQWQSSTIPTTVFTPGVWVRLQAEFVMDLVKRTTTHVSLRVNELNNVVNIVRAATAQVQGDYFSVGWQLDSNGKTIPTPYVCKTRNMHVLY